MSEEGKCPKCGSFDLDHGSVDDKADGVYYPFVCNACGFRGREYYYLHFNRMTNETGEKSY